MRLNIANTLHWRDSPKPAIALVQGYCSMGGLGKPGSPALAAAVRAESERTATTCHWRGRLQCDVGRAFDGAGRRVERLADYGGHR